ncbi:hypothetical protein [Sinomicrobium oceani]|nr:hypothetical protein [Sinomicrobium oceani]
MVKHYEFPDFVPNLELELHPEAIATNYLDSTAGLNNGFIVDNELRLLMSSFTLPKHHFYPIKVYKGAELLDYYWFHFLPDNFWEMIDYNTSYMELIKSSGEVIDGFVPILSKSEMVKLLNSIDWSLYLRIGQIYMKPEAAQYDLYKTDCLGSNILISKNLKDSITKAGLTGMEIKPFDKFSISK